MAEGGGFRESFGRGLRELSDKVGYLSVVPQNEITQVFKILKIFGQLLHTQKYLSEY